ncbi:hypothetical protein LCGC14_2063910, partial [marine sediment metagenome]
PQIMKVAGKPGKIEKLDDLRVRFSFDKPNGLFLIKLATPSGLGVVGRPAHYLRKYHPRIGDERAIREMMAARKLASRLDVYNTVREENNPEHPRLWPWVYRTHRANPPYTFVRNPYYWMVDTAGNQLPYIDRLHFQVRGRELINTAAANGQLSMQRRHLSYDQYTLLMSERAKSKYEVLHWYPADSSNFVISPNLNLRIDPDKPETAKKHALLNDKRFRQALSLAINRREIIQAEYNGQTEPAQVAPGPASYFYEPSLYKSFTDHDPARANRLLDEIGLTRRDYEGYRTFADGSRMVFYLNLCAFLQAGPSQFIIDDWKRVGVRVILRMRTRQLWATEMAAMTHDLTAWGSDSEYLPLLAPRFFVPIGYGCFYAQGFAKWNNRGGLYGDPLAKGPGCIEPPKGHPLRRAMEIFETVAATGDPAEQRERFREVLKIAAENVWTINICTAPPQLVVVKDGLRNVPASAVSCWNFITPGNTGIETYFFEESTDSPGAVRQIARAIEKVTPPPDAPAAVAQAEADSGWLAPVIKWLCIGIVAGLIVLSAVRHPYIARRLMIMVPTLLVISVIVFTIIHLPPGDYVTSRIMELREAGDQADLKRIEDLRKQFHLEDPVAVRYVRWLGLNWFASIRPERTDGFPYFRLTADAAKAGLLQGNLGRSMANSRPVNEIVGDRILLTVVISLGTVLFTWALAIPTGIFSAV